NGTKLRATLISQKFSKHREIISLRIFQTLNVKAVQLAGLCSTRFEAEGCPKRKTARIFSRVQSASMNIRCSWPNIAPPIQSRKTLKGWHGGDGLLFPLLRLACC